MARDRETGRMTTAPTSRGPIAAEILALLVSIERHGPYAPAVAAFKSALRRKDIEADAAGAPQLSMTCCML